MLQTSLLTDRKFLGYNNICVAEIRDNAASGCGSAWLEHLVWDQGVASSNLVTPTIDRPSRFHSRWSFFALTSERVVLSFCCRSSRSPAHRKAKGNMTECTNLFIFTPFLQELCGIFITKMSENCRIFLRIMI